MPTQLAWSVDKDDDFDVRDFAVRLLEGAKENLERDGELASVAFVVTDTQLQCHAVTFGDHEQKEAAYRDLVSAAKAANATALAQSEYRRAPRNLTLPPRGRVATARGRPARHSDGRR